MLKNTFYIVISTLRWLFFQKSLGDVLNSYVYALTQWSRSGGDECLSAADAKDKTKSVIEEMITITKQVEIPTRTVM